MKLILRLVPLFVAAVFARADIIIEQKMESAMINGNVTMKLKGERARPPHSPTPVHVLTVSGAAGAKANS